MPSGRAAINQPSVSLVLSIDCFEIDGEDTHSVRVGWLNASDEVTVTAQGNNSFSTLDDGSSESIS